MIQKGTETMFGNLILVLMKAFDNRSLLFLLVSWKSTSRLIP